MGLPELPAETGGGWSGSPETPADTRNCCTGFPNPQWTNNKVGWARLSLQWKQNVHIETVQGSQLTPAVTVAEASLQGTGIGAGTGRTPAVPTRGTNVGAGTGWTSANPTQGTGMDTGVGVVTDALYIYFTLIYKLLQIS